jgi:hypothetical protein
MGTIDALTQGELVPDWPFEDPPNTAAITARSVIDDGAPILLVTHDLEDGGWQFLSGSTEDTTEARVVGLGRICARDVSLLELADLPEGWRAWRANAAAPWQRGPA